MSAAQDRADIDAALAEDGEWIELHRLVGTQQIPIKLRCRAFVRGVSAEMLAAGVKQDTSTVIISPTEIIAKGWPGPNSSATPATADRRVPKLGDKALIAGKIRQIEVALPTYVDGELVRIELRVQG